MRHSSLVMVAVFVGGAVGTSVRFAVDEAMTAVGASEVAPILTVNLVGALVLGWLAQRARSVGGWSTPFVAFVGVGVLGSFTTFSALSVQSVEMFRTGAWLGGTAYVIVSVMGGWAAARFGRRIGMAR